MPLPSGSLFPSTSLLPGGDSETAYAGRAGSLSMANWSFLLADSRGNNLAELSTAAGRTLTFQRNGVPEARMSISHDDEAAGLLFTALRDGVPLLRAYRDGILRFHGYLAPFDEELEEETRCNLVFRGPFGRLLGDGNARGFYTLANRTFTATDAGQIAKTLISEANGGIDTTSGSIEASKIRDRAYQYANVGEAVVNLSRVLDGFDFEITPIEYATGNIGVLNVYAAQGDVLAGVRFEYGPDTLRNVRRVTRQIQPPVNVVRVLGANGLASNQQHAGSIATFGYWPQQTSYPDVSEQATLDDKAQALLRPDPVKVIGFTPEPELAPRPWDDYWLGDTVAFYGRRGAFEDSVTARVHLVTVVVDEEGNESTEIEDPAQDGSTIDAAIEAEVVG